MGTQEMLMIALGVIIVGVAVAVGITMFINQGYNANKRALASEMTTYPPTLERYWSASKLLGGAGADSAEVTTTSVAGYLGFSGPNNSQSSDNGEFRVISVNGTVVVIKAVGVGDRGGRHPVVITTIDLATNTIDTAFADAAGW
jgi:hypothetical protein